MSVKSTPYTKETKKESISLLAVCMLENFKNGYKIYFLFEMSVKSMIYTTR